MKKVLLFVIAGFFLMTSCSKKVDCNCEVNSVSVTEMDGEEMGEQTFNSKVTQTSDKGDCSEFEGTQETEQTTWGMKMTTTTVTTCTEA
ncbi:MAG: hypothetical protein LAT54_08170 [Cryomorphaceae bacterium]|nr:hypothetical protein [Cryomorphaceae bacterium]